ncbi:MAG: NAD(P)H-hydrate dehydratase [Brevundimonas sp.]|uniref:NAD(P)H-hydrate dehydratase n=1 Tax=Brevundimonas sp. TaxID=1871086 RepID=UPI0025B8843B|nr:NAD(P)H-hydrate dehydratase [Brevundimonas sp.]MBX3475997.1 NAD(P)H-hydrate dehydratase [Brevundimonas sp.]
MTDINHPDLWRGRIPWPGPDSHKHARGRLGVVSGDACHTGAARLAARAGLRVGAGLVKVFCPPDAAPVLAPALEAVMLSPFGDAAELARSAEPMGAVVIGPAAGVTQATHDNVRALATLETRLVLDADALTVFADEPQALFDLLGPQDVLTPHEAEFGRLFSGLLAMGREAAAAEAARRAGCVLVLKGARTLIAAPDGRMRTNPNGSPWLATAGTGDVLAGMIGGLLAQGVEAFEAASMAVWMHADAATRFGPGLIAEDLPDGIPGVLAALRD